VDRVGKGMPGEFQRFAIGLCWFIGSEKYS